VDTGVSVLEPQTLGSDEVEVSPARGSELLALLLTAGAACATTRASGGLEVRAGARAVYMLKRPGQRKIAGPIR
jgi:hypothetical protein